MAYPRLSAATPIAQQIRTTGLGVNNGGTKGRTTQTHKGVSLNRWSGGMNTKGSGNKQLPHRVTAARPSTGAVVRPYKPASAPKPTTPKPAVSAPVSAAPVAPQRPSGPLDYRGLSSYMSGMADLEYSLGGDRAELASQLDEHKRQYTRNLAESKRGYERSVETDEDSLNHAGLLRSGKREVVDADRYREFNQYLADLESQHGAGAAAKINQALARLDEWEAQQRKAIEQDARMTYDELYPAAPIDVNEPRVPPAQKPAGVTKPVYGKPAHPDAGGTGTGGQVPAGTRAPALAGSGLDSSAFKSQYVDVWDAKKKRNVKADVNNLSRKDLLAAMSRSINQKYLADGWRVVNGRIVKG